MIRSNQISIAVTGIFLFALSQSCFAQSRPGFSKNQTQALRYIEKRKNELISWSDSVWKFAELPLHEARSSRLLIDILKEEGFEVQEKVSGFSTVFIATYGKAKPVIGLFGEYDADENASNKVVPRKEPLVPGGNGHGGGHNLLGLGSLGAALTIKDLIANGKLKCTIRYYGTTAEGGIGSKTYLARDGYFDDLDLSLYWHPAPATWASTKPWDALVDLDITLMTRKSNIIFRSSDDPTGLDAFEMLVNELGKLRTLNSEKQKLNYTLTVGKTRLSETPDTTKFSVRLQSSRQEEVLHLLSQIRLVVSKISAITKVENKLVVVRALHQFLPNVKAMQSVQKNMERVGPIGYSEEEQQFVRELQQFMKQNPEGIKDDIAPFNDESQKQTMYGYASDIGDASWIAPEIYFVVRSLPGVPMHQWPGTIFTGHAIGHKGLLQASRVLALTIVDYVENPSLQKSIRNDFEMNRKIYRYQSLLPAAH